MSKKIAIIVDRLRKEKNLSQEQLSVRSGLDRTYVSHLLNGRRRFNEDILFKLAKGLDVHPSEFFIDIEPEKMEKSTGVSEDKVKGLVRKLQVEFCAGRPLDMQELKDALEIGLELRQRLGGDRIKSKKKESKSKKSK